jgi:iron complex outermembrane receptor protein
MVRAIGVTLALGVLGCVTAPGWANENQAVMSESARAAHIQELQRDRADVERELRQLRSQPEGTARSTVPRSEFSDQPTRSMKESLESMPGVSARQGSSGRDVQLSIRGSK